MPYNTRRKSLSLPSLGIHVPNGPRSTMKYRSTSGDSASPPVESSPPTKKTKRSHSPSSPSTIQVHQIPMRYEHTPPPSPGAVREVKVDLEGISDEVVTSTIELLQQNGNCPIMIKDLAASLIHSLPVVSGSANPPAIVSSRINSYIKRPWTALAPCPLAKELVTTHPRRIYFYLTTMPHQPIPEPQSPSTRRSVISPSLTSEDEEERKRDTMSPSPEIDLSAPDFLSRSGEITPLTPNDSFSNHSQVNTPAPYQVRASSPPLEKVEKEFTATASSMLLQQLQRQRSQSSPVKLGGKRPVEEKEQDREVPSKSQDDFLLVPRSDESTNGLLASSPLASPMVSPFLHPVRSSLNLPIKRRLEETMELDHIQPSPNLEAKRPRSDLFEGITLNLDLGAPMNWMSVEMRSPENVELDELDDWLGSY